MTRFIAYAAAVTSALACTSITGCKPSLRSPASVHALPVSVRAVRPFNSSASAAQSPGQAASAVAITHVRTLPLYKDAQRACVAKHYSHAADLLLKLSRTPGLTSDETAFCLTQVDVCRRDAGLKELRSSVSDRNQSAQIGPNTQNPRPNTTFSADCGPRALDIACQQLNVPTDIAALRKAAGTTKDGTTMEGLAKAAKALGLKAEGIQVGRDALPHIQTPAIAWYKGNHYITVLELKGGPGDAGTARIHDPNDEHETVISQEQLLRKSNGGYLLLVHR